LSQVGSTKKRIGWQIKNEINQSFTAKVREVDFHLIQSHSKEYIQHSEKIFYLRVSWKRWDQLRVIQIICDAKGRVWGGVATVSPNDTRGWEGSVSREMWPLGLKKIYFWKTKNVTPHIGERGGLKSAKKVSLT